MLLFSGSKILSGYIYDTIGINIKGNLDLRNSTSCWRDSIQTELSKGFIISCKLSLTLYNVDINSGLVICCSREDLALLGRDGCISLDQTGCDTSHGLDGQRQRSNIQKKDITCTSISCQLTTLNGSTDCYTLIRVQSFARLMSGQLFYFILYCRDTCRTTYQQNFAKLRRADTCITKCCLYRVSSTLYQIVGQFIEFCSGQVHIKVKRTICIHADERKVDIGCSGSGKLFLSFLSCLFQSLQCHLVISKIYTVLFLELGDHPVSYFLVEVIAAQMVVTSGCQNFDNTITDLDDRYIKGTTTKVIYHDLLFFLIIKTICKCCCSRLVDDTFYIQTCDLTSILGCLSLCIIEVCRYSDNCFGYFLAQIVLSICFQFLKDHCGDLLRRIVLSVNVYSVISSHMSLNRGNSLLSVGNCLTFCRLTNQTLTGLCECHDRRCGSCSFCICNNGGFSTFHNCYTRVRCS